MRGFSSGAGAGDVAAAPAPAATREARSIALRPPPVGIDPEPVGARALGGGAGTPYARVPDVSPEA